MKYFTILLLSVLLLFFASFNKYKSQLTHAKTYEIVGEQMINLTKSTRKAKIWFITSEANSCDEFAQTSILAAMELHKKHREFDLIQVVSS